MIESNAQWWSIDNLKKKNHDKFFLKEKFFECFSKGRYNVYLDGKFFLCGLSAHGRQLKCFPDGEYFVDLRLNEINKHKRKKN
ncbi:MAG: Pseudogene of conserved hypothetical protein [Methanobrevibacter sp. CfCl-M3]